MMVQSGDVIAEIETDKATMEVEAVDEGTIAKLLVDEGSEGVAVNAVIAVLVEEGEDPKFCNHERRTCLQLRSPAISPAIEEFDRHAQSNVLPTDTPLTAAASAPVTGINQAGGVSRPLPWQSELQRKRGLISQFCKALAQGDASLSAMWKMPPQTAAQTTAGSVEQQGASVQSVTGPTPFTAQKPNGMRKVIAKRLSESKFTSPHFYVTMDMELDALMALRKQINANPEELKVSVNDLIIMACGRALKAVPEANAAWVGEEIHYYERADVSVAVALTAASSPLSFAGRIRRPSAKLTPRPMI